MGLRNYVGEVPIQHSHMTLYKICSSSCKTYVGDACASSLQNAENSFAVALDTRVVSVAGPAAVTFTQLQPVMPKTDLRIAI